MHHSVMMLVIRGVNRSTEKGTKSDWCNGISQEGFLEQFTSELRIRGEVGVGQFKKKQQ